MRRERSRALAGLALAGLAAVLWILFAPAQLGGSASYTTTEGISMEPLFHKGDLAISRPASSYRVGDVVLYRSPVLHRPVLHRILVVQHGRYFFKGDNNDFVDPGWVTRDQLVGKLWVHVPRAGLVVSWFGKPLHSAAIAGLAVLLLVLGGGRSVRKRRRGRRRGAWRKPRVTPRTFMRHVHRPRRTPENIAAAAVGILAVVLLVVGFTKPTEKPAQVGGAYRSSGTFSYRANVIRPVSIYPTGVAHAGQPLFLDDFKTLQLGFEYRFASRLRHDVHGTIGLDAVMSSADTNWHRAFQLVRTTGFAGDAASVKGSLDLRAIRQLMLDVATSSGAVGANYTIELQPVVRLRGTVGHKKLDETFSPTLPMDLSQSVLNIDATAPAPPPGASYTQPSAQSTLDAALNPVRTGSVSGLAPEYVSLAHLRVPVSTVRGLALGLLLLTLLILFTKPLQRRRREVWTPERRIAHRYECVIVDVVSITDGAVATAPPTEIPDFESLATLARYCERPILRETIAGTPSYAVEDGGRLYVYRAAPPAKEPVAAPVAPPVERPRPRVPALVRYGAPTLLLVLLVTAAVAFTGSNTVPASYAGVSTKPVSTSQLAPALCSGISPTNLLVMTTNSTTGTAAGDLVLGSNLSGTVTISGGGGNDCLVGGGGPGTTNKFDGGPGTNVCIGAPGATNTFRNCQTTG